MRSTNSQKEMSSEFTRSDVSMPFWTFKIRCEPRKRAGISCGTCEEKYSRCECKNREHNQHIPSPWDDASNGCNVDAP